MDDRGYGSSEWKRDNIPRAGGKPERDSNDFRTSLELNSFGIQITGCADVNTVGFPLFELYLRLGSDHLAQTSVESRY